MEHVGANRRNLDLIPCEEERRELRSARGLHLDEPFASRLLEGEDVVPETVTACLRDVLDTFGERTLSCLPETAVLELQDRELASGTERAVVCLYRIEVRRPRSRFAQIALTHGTSRRARRVN